MKVGENWNYYKTPKNGKGPTKYYYYESIFTNAELITLIDSVETYNYFSTDDIAGLVSKLLGLRPRSEYLSKYNNKNSYYLKDEDSLVLANIDEFSRILKAHQFAEIIYCNYDHNFQLIPRKKYPRIVYPLAMMWSNGYYYLVALFAPRFTPANLRMDRITQIKAVTPTPEMKKAYQTDTNFDATTYRMEHPVMYDGKIQHITMLYFDNNYNGMHNSIRDTFGKLATIRPTTQEELQQHLSQTVVSVSEQWMRADFKATANGTKLFATQYSPYCKIIYPTELQDAVKENLLSGLQLY